MAKLKALVIGECLQLTIALPSLLSRSGFEVDVITTNPIVKKSRFISNLELVRDRNLMPLIADKKNPDNYNFIVVSDDATLSLILNSEISFAAKMKILPINSEENLQHLYSKIGLSLTLSKAGVTIPDFIVVNGICEVREAAKKLQYPVMIKTNSDGGGNGVFECNNDADINKISSSFLKFPLLVQKKITGTELDLSGLYRNGKLIYFTYSQIRKVANKFGPSSLRLYKQLSIIDKEIFVEMQNLGKALGANGFINISCIESDQDKKRYFFEADMRPNSWVEFAKFIGDDPAVRIANWFKNGTELQYPCLHNEKYPSQIIMPYFMRLTSLEILFNCYKVWKFLPFREYRMLLELLYDKIIKDNLKTLFAVIRRYYRHPKILFGLKRCQTPF